MIIQDQILIAFSIQLRASLVFYSPSRISASLSRQQKRVQSKPLRRTRSLCAELATTPIVFDNRFIKIVQISSLITQLLVRISATMSPIEFSCFWLCIFQVSHGSITPVNVLSDYSWNLDIQSGRFHRCHPFIKDSHSSKKNSLSDAAYAECDFSVCLFVASSRALNM